MDTIETIRYAGRKPSVRAPVHGGVVNRIMFVFGSVVGQLGRMLERRRGRLALLEMTDEQLKDIGVSRCDAHLEGIRSFWE
jgi:uncharacterized protein YjiS (DUF1127 family)